VAASTGTRARVVIYSLATAGSGNDAWCRSDGASAVLNYGVRIQPGGGYEWDYPTVGNAAINCIMVSASATLAGEAFQ
jgi:hypothetical protein